jgi:general secretion pathway protein A
MYNSFFKFQSNPFQLTPDPEFLFMSKIHKKALTYIKYGINSDSTGFILFTGEVGTGKTTIIRSLIKEIKRDLNLAMITNTLVTSDQLISMINEDFGINTAGKDKTRMLRDLTEFLIEQYGKSRKTILIIDEAQNLTPESLEQIRLLSNLETDKAKLLQIILVGQSELRKVLARPVLRALKQRINISCHIYPLLRDETEEYISHRLNIAGNREAVHFHDGSMELIHNFSRGIPRLINIICDFLLLSAFTENTQEVSLDMVKEIIRDLEKDRWDNEVHYELADNVNFLKELPSISKNMGQARDIAVDTQVAHDEKTLSGNKLSTITEFLSSTVERLKTDLPQKEHINSDVPLSNIMREIQKLKEITSELKKEELKAAVKERKKKNLWARIFAP